MLIPIPPPPTLCTVLLHDAATANPMRFHRRALRIAPPEPPHPHDGGIPTHGAPTRTNIRGRVNIARRCVDSDGLTSPHQPFAPSSPPVPPPPTQCGSIGALYESRRWNRPTRTTAAPPRTVHPPAPPSAEVRLTLGDFVLSV